MSAKRKAAAAALSHASNDDVQTPPLKRRKVPSATNNLSRVGHELLAQIRTTKDKHGWKIATNFLALPDRDEIPEYYDEIALPIALDTIEEKLDSGQYDSVSQIESDFMRLVVNAKHFNESSSQIFAEAEKIRKLVISYMTENNPAYKTPGYQATATPIPETPGSPVPKRSFLKGPKAIDVSEKPITHIDNSKKRNVKGRSRKQSRGDSDQDEVEASEDAVADQEDGSVFKGKTFSEAQDQLLTEMMELTSDDNILIGANFVNLPSRSLTDYYRMTKHPVSLKGIQKLARGQKGHASPTGQSLLTSWSSFEQEVDYIWSNARDYNEEDSEIVGLATQLQKYFGRRLQAAKSEVQEPAAPRVKLKLAQKPLDDAPPKITLKFGTTRTDTESAAQPDGVASKSEERTDITSKDPTIRSETSAVKRHEDKELSVPVTADRPGRRAFEQNSATPRGLSMQPEPRGVTNAVVGYGIEYSDQQETASTKQGEVATVAATAGKDSSIDKPSSTESAAASTTVSHTAATNFFSTKRPDGKDASDALISSVKIVTHPDSKLAQRFKYEIAASSQSTQQTVTITLGASSSYLRITPSLATSLLQRPSKTLVTFNNRRQQAVTQSDPSHTHPIYDFLLSTGMNNLEIEVIAGVPRGSSSTNGASDLEIEKPLACLMNGTNAREIIGKFAGDIE